MDGKGFARQWPWCQGQVKTLAVATRWTVIEALAVIARGKAKWVLRRNKCNVLVLGRGEHYLGILEIPEFVFY